MSGDTTIHVINVPLLGIIIEEEGHGFSYIIGQKESIACCSKNKNLLRTFNKGEEVDLAKKEIVDHLERHNSTRGLRLADVGQPDLN